MAAHRLDDAPEQADNIYWLLAPSRQSALDSAYMEAFKAKGIEVGASRASSRTPFTLNPQPCPSTLRPPHPALAPSTLSPPPSTLSPPPSTLRPPPLTLRPCALIPAPVRPPTRAPARPCARARAQVLLLYSTVDEFVMSNLMNYGGKSLLSAENAKLDLDAPSAADVLGEAEAEGLKGWIVDK
eukprot:635677-Prymnesium_polylepis.1